MFLQCKNLQNEEFCNFYLSCSTVMMVKSRRLQWTGLVAQMEKINTENFVWKSDNMKGQDNILTYVLRGQALVM